MEGDVYLDGVELLVFGAVYLGVSTLCGCCFVVDGDVYFGGEVGLGAVYFGVSGFFEGAVYLGVEGFGVDGLDDGLGAVYLGVEGFGALYLGVEGFGAEYLGVDDFDEDDEDFEPPPLAQLTDWTAKTAINKPATNFLHIFYSFELNL